MTLSSTDAGENAGKIPRSLTRVFPLVFRLITVLIVHQLDVLPAVPLNAMFTLIQSLHNALGAKPAFHIWVPRCETTGANLYTKRRVVGDDALGRLQAHLFRRPFVFKWFSSKLWIFMTAWSPV